MFGSSAIAPIRLGVRDPAAASKGSLGQQKLCSFMVNSALAQNVPCEKLMGNNRRRHAIEAYQLSTFCPLPLISAERS